MKYILAAMCGIAALFMGGCAFVTVFAMPFSLLPAGIAFLNLAVLGAIFGWKLQWRPAFYILAAIDVGVALVGIGFAVEMPSADQPLFWIVVGVFLLKAVLTLLYARTPAEPAP